ncbi:MAG: family 16 glycoside hydrolase, partial [Planctomycetota bacterium]
MTHSTKKLVLTFIATVMVAIPCIAQDVEPPFTWEGKGAGSFISEGGVEELAFQFELSVDEQGVVKGQTSSENGIARIKHVFSTEPKQYDFPGFFTRKIVIVFMLNEDGDTPMLSILNGRVLVDKFLYGEVLLTTYEEDSEIAKALGVGDPEATLMEGDEIPNKLKSVLKKCFPIGIAKIEGDYKKEETDIAEGSESIDLFNKKDFTGWYMYLKDTDADPKSVWRVLDGEIYCSGESTGFLRTKQEYSDYKL